MKDAVEVPSVTCYLETLHLRESRPVSRTLRRTARLERPAKGAKLRLASLLATSANNAKTCTIKKNKSI